MIGDERAVEGHDRIPAAGEAPCVEPQPVVHGPAGQGKDGGQRDGSGPAQAMSPRSREEEREGRECEENDIPRSNERKHGHTEADEREACDRRRCRSSDHEQRPACEGGGEHRLARQLVEHQAVAGVHEEGGGCGQGNTGPEEEPGRAPRDDRRGEQDGCDRLGKRTSGDIQ